MRNQLTNPGEPIRDVIYIGWIRTSAKSFTIIIPRLLAGYQNINSSKASNISEFNQIPVAYIVKKFILSIEQ